MASRTYGWFASLGLGLAVLALAPTAHSAPTQAEKSKAAWRLEEGKRAQSQGKLEEAVAAFREAHGVLALPTSGILLARALEKSGKLAEARRVAHEVAKSPRLDKEAFSITSARADAEKLAKSLDERTPRLLVGSASEVTVDGQPAVIEEGRAFVDPGARKVAAKGLAETELTFAERDEKSLPTPQPTAPTGRDAPAATAAAPAAAPKREAAAEKTSGAKKDDAATAAGFIGFGAFAAGAGMGLGAFLGATSKLADLEDRCGGECTGPLAREQRDYERLRIFGYAGFGLAGAGLVTGIVGAAVSAGSAPDEDAKAARVELGLGYVGVNVPL